VYTEYVTELNLLTSMFWGCQYTYEIYKASIWQKYTENSAFG